ncbi:MAG: type II toxin-antitoxin system VapC family toxin [Planctomycetaceae bacterium]|jgi:PIN domain nuclease of toxin-antitoxin system|nr:type II toxin-antitoxin system VapC family toxin [Planctomycetaceae bacterium]
MNLLLDTHTLIWFFDGDIQLSEKAKHAIIDSQNQKFVSMVSIWEIAIKISLKKLVFEGNIGGILELIDTNGFELLRIDKKSILGLENIPFIHRDPFDRLLVATAISEEMFLITKDSNIQKYPVNVIW